MSFVFAVVCLVFFVGCGGDEVETPRTQAEAEIGEIRRALEVRPEAPLLHFQLGQTYQQYGFVDSARAAFERCVERYESFAEAHLQLAQIYYEDGDLERSVKAYEQTVRFDGDNAVAYNNLGFVYKKLDRLDEAVRLRRRAPQVAHVSDMQEGEAPIRQRKRAPLGAGSGDQILQLALGHDHAAGARVHQR